MEAIKFSELPSGDRMPLADEDGVPIIASQENRLLTWGRLKKQLAEQTHTSEVKPEDTKVPTSAAVENRIAAAEETLGAQIKTASDSAADAQTKASAATQTASEAKTAASSAKSSADDATAAANAAKTAAESATSSISAVSERVSSAETKAEGAKTTAETAQATADTAKAAAILAELILREMTYETSNATGVNKLLGDCQEMTGTDIKLADVVGVYNGNFQAIHTAIQFLKDDINDNGIYTGWRVEITAGSTDNENGLMTGAPSISETTEEVDASLSVPETLALIFRNQEAMYQILLDTRKRALANATNLTAMLANINAVLSQVMN